jgi:hypothetical protein
MTPLDIALLASTAAVGVALVLYARRPRPSRQERDEKAILEALADHPEGLAGYELQLTTLISVRAVALALYRLEERGLVRCWPAGNPGSASPPIRLYGLTQKAAA